MRSAPTKRRTPNAPPKLTPDAKISRQARIVREQPHKSDSHSKGALEDIKRHQVGDREQLALQGSQGRPST